MSNGTRPGLGRTLTACLIVALSLSAGCKWNGEQQSHTAWGFPDSESFSRKDIQAQRAASLSAYQASLNLK